VAGVPSAPEKRRRYKREKALFYAENGQEKGKGGTVRM